MRVHVNHPHVIAEVFDDEVVAVNFKTGSYYGLSGTALEIWRNIQDGADLEPALTGLAGRFTADPAAVRASCESFLDRLIEEELVIAEGDRPAPVPPVTGADFPAPVLHVYEDMKDLLLLDPIHDVDETGWPVAKPDNDSEGNSK